MTQALNHPGPDEIERTNIKQIKMWLTVKKPVTGPQQNWDSAPLCGQTLRAKEPVA